MSLREALLLRELRGEPLALSDAPLEALLLALGHAEPPPPPLGVPASRSDVVLRKLSLLRALPLPRAVPVPSSTFALRETAFVAVPKPEALNAVLRLKLALALTEAQPVLLRDRSTEPEGSGVCELESEANNEGVTD